MARKFKRFSLGKIIIDIGRTLVLSIGFNITVSKTTKELLLEWDESHQQPVIVAEDLRMPQFEMQKITTNKCHETNHMGKLITNIYSLMTTPLRSKIES